MQLWKVDFVDNDIGVWNRQWFLAEDEARAYFDDAVANRGFDHRNGDVCGEFGDICEPDLVYVEPSPEGLLQFANAYAVDHGE